MNVLKSTFLSCSIILFAFSAHAQRPMGPDDFAQASYQSVRYCDISLDRNGNPWLIYDENTDGASSRALENGVWKQKGKRYMTNYCKYTDIVHDKFNNAWFVCTDANSDKATVRKYVNGTWIIQGNAAFTPNGADYTRIAIDSGGNAWVAFQDATSDKINVMKLVNGTWTTQGSANFSAGDATEIQIAMDSKGNPWVAYKDWSNVGKATVMKLVNGTWTVQGSAGFSTGSANDLSLAIDSKDNPWLSYQDGTQGSKATVMKLVNGTWTTQGSAGFSASGVSGTALALGPNDVPWVAYNNSPGFGFSMMKLVNGTWIQQGDQKVTAYYLSSLNIEIDKSGFPWVAFGDAAINDKVTVMKFEDSTWKLQGAHGASNCTVFDKELLLDTQGAPWIAYTDYHRGSKISARKFVNDSWLIQGKEGFTQGYSMKMLMDSKGNPWIINTNPKDTTLEVWKFTGSAWDLQGKKKSRGNSGVLAVVMGKDDLPWILGTSNKATDTIRVHKLETGGTLALKGDLITTSYNIDYTSIAIDSSGTPWLAYSEESPGNRGTAKKLVNGSWVTQGGLITTGRALGIALKFDRHDSLWVLISDYSGSTHYQRVKKLRNGNWVQMGKSSINSGNFIHEGQLHFDTAGTAWVLYSRGNDPMLCKLHNNLWKDKIKPGLSAGYGNQLRAVITKENKFIVSYTYPEIWVKGVDMLPDYQLSIYGNKTLIAAGDSLISGSDSTSFGNMAIKTSRTVRYQLKNTGTDSIIISGNPRVKITGPNASEFTVMNPVPAVIKAGDSVWLNIRHNPLSGGQRIAYVNISSNDEVNKVYSFAIGSTSMGCNTTSPLANTAGFLYRASISEKDSLGWTCYCDSVGKLMIALKIGTTGAVVNNDQVFLKLGSSTTFSSTSSGFMISNPDGYSIIDRRWYIKPATQPTAGNVGVRYFFTAPEFAALKTAAASLPKPSTLSSVNEMTVYRTTSGAAFANPHTVNGVVLRNNSFPAITFWKLGQSGSDHFAEFEVSSITGGGAGTGGGGGSGPAGFFLSAPEINLKGNAFNITSGDTFPASLDSTSFGPFNKASISRSFVIENTGNKKLLVSSIGISGINASEFSIIGRPDSVSAGGSARFYVKLTPTGSGVKSAFITINSNDADEPAYTFKVQATKTAPEILVRGNTIAIMDGDITPSLPDSTDFGASKNATVTRSFSIENLGTDTLFFSGIGLSGTNASLFSVSSLPPFIKAQSAVRFYVKYTPTADGTHTATVSINNSDADEAVYNFDISATKKSTGISELISDRVSVLPNPAFSDLNIFIEKDFVNAEIMIYSTEGKLVLHEVLQNAGNNSVDIRNIAPGIYSVVVKVDGEMVVKRVVINYEL